MKKYFSVFKISWQDQLEYRFNFFFGRLRNIIFLILLYFIWQNLSLQNGSFAGYTSIELFTYVFGINILRSVTFGSQSRTMAMDINEGTFSTYLIKPVNHFLFTFFRELAERCLYFIFSIAEVAIFIALLRVKLFVQLDLKILGLFFIAVVLAVILYFILSYAVSLLAFWSRESLGPRFLYEWILEFASGAYFPLNILSNFLFLILKFLPFAYLAYFPISVYLGKISLSHAWQIIGLQVVWIIAAAFLTRFIWLKGLKKYTSEGI